MSAPTQTTPRFGTFAGVFTPTLLTILGVIMYLRLPWVIGNAGLLGGLAIIVGSVAITLATGLSLSSVASNTRLGAGGPYAVIARSLGLEIAGSVGVPLYLSQALVVAMYIFGFREGWLWVFPTHDPLWVDYGTFLVVFALAFTSADLSFRVQYGVLAVIALSLVAIFGDLSVWTTPREVPLIGGFRGSPTSTGESFWSVFAVFFPATTGIMAGANMSGELQDPRRAIPRGTLSAIALSSVIYVLLACWVAWAGDETTLVGSYTFFIDKALWGPPVLAGLLGATFSSALTSLVGAPRILVALAQDGLVPRGEALTVMSDGGEPRRATLLTAGLVAMTLAVRDLNAIAPLITGFFLITYAVINVVMLVESSLGLVSFRPTLRLPMVVPLVGTLGCLFAMFIINPTFSLVAMGMVVALYVWILQQEHPKDRDDVRSGIFVATAEWAARRSAELGIRTARAWQPGFLVPVVRGAELRGEFKLLVDACSPSGTVTLLGLAEPERSAELAPRIAALGQQLRDRGVFANWSVIDTVGFEQGTLAALQAMQGAFFRPNLLLLPLPEEAARRSEIDRVVREAHRLEIGVVVLGLHATAGLGREAVINVWVRPPDEGQPLDEALRAGSLNLGLLLSYRIASAWRAELNLMCAVPDDEAAERARAWIAEVRDLARVPAQANTRVHVGPLATLIADAPQSDLDILGLPAGPDLERAATLVAETRSSCLFCLDSGRESALA